jgi:F-type H+-transporting ATPase subunit gamma
MRVMIAPRPNVHDKLEALTGDYRRLRQEEITSEIVALSAGSIGADPPSNNRARATGTVPPVASDTPTPSWTSLPRNTMQRARIR